MRPATVLSVPVQPRPVEVAERQRSAAGRSQQLPRRRRRSAAAETAVSRLCSAMALGACVLLVTVTGTAPSPPARPSLSAPSRIRSPCRWPMDTPRCTETLTSGWLFSNTSASSTAATARPVTIPHDFVIEGDFVHDLGNRDHGYLPRGVGYYTRTVEAPAAGAGGTAYLHFEGAFRDTSVYVDGALVLHHLSGYTGFTVPLTRRSQVLTVVCNATLGEGWFY